MKKLLPPLFALAALALPARADALDTTRFGKYAEFTASGNASGGTAIENLPVPVHFSAANIGGLDYNDIGLTKQAAYSTLRFADANGNNLDYEIATWNPSGESIVWVSVPSIKSTTTKFTAYFAPDAGYTLPAVYPTNVWTKLGYIGVWHLDEKNGEGKYEDSSGVTGAVGPVDANASYPDPTAVTAYGVGNYLANNAAGLFIPSSVSANWDFGDTGVTFESWALPGGDWEQMFSNVPGQNVPGFIIGVAQNKIRWSTKGDGWRKTCKDNNWAAYAAEWRHLAVTYMKSSGSALSKGCVYLGYPEHGSDRTALSRLDAEVYPSTRENQFTFDNGCYLMCSVGNTILGVDEIRIRASETVQVWARANYLAQKSDFLTYSAVKVTGAKISSTGITASNPSYSTATVSGTFDVDSSVVGDVSVSLVVTPAGGTAYTVSNVGTISTSSTSVNVSLDDLLPGTAYAVSFQVTYDGKTTSSASAAFSTTALPVPTLSGVGDTGATLSGAFSLSGASYAAGTANAVFTETLTGSSVSAPVADLSAPTATATTLSPDSDYRVRFVFARPDGTTVQTRTVLCSTTGTTTLDPSSYGAKLSFTASGYAGSTTLANFPVLVRLSTDIQGFDYAKITASDIRFADANGILLAHDIERWDSTGTSLIWVSVPSLSGTTTAFTMYWNPKSGKTVPAARAPQRVWTLAGYAAVWHFNEQNVDGSYPDASGYGATAVLNGGGATPNAPTTEGTSANDSPWHVANSYLKVDAANTADWFFSETGYTVETWIKPSPKLPMGGWDERDRMFTWGAGDTTGNTFEIGRDLIGQYDGDNPGNKATWPSDIQDKDVWRLLTAVWKPASGASFADVGSFCNGAIQVLNKGLAAVDFTENGMGLTGTLAPKGLLDFPIDEIRIRRGGTTADWMNANYATQVAGSTFLTAGQVQEESLPVTLTIPSPLQANVSLVSVTTNGVAVTGNAGVYTVLSHATVAVSFAAAEGYRLVGAATVDVVMAADRTLTGIPTAELIPEVSTPQVGQSATKVYARKTVLLTASAEGATSYYWLKNGVAIEGGENGTLTVAWRSPKGNPTDYYQAVAVYDIDGLPADSEASTALTVTNLPMGTVISVRGGTPAPPKPHDYSADYLTFRVLTSGTISWKSFGDTTKTFEYKINDGEWTSITSTADGATISVVEGDLVRFRGSNTTYATSKSAYSGFDGGTATYDIEGNIMSLLYGDDFAESTTLTGNGYTFCSLFKKAPVVSAEHLVLPATTLKEYCYRALFSWCTTLTKAPELPATTLAKGCYWYMFEQCAISEAPVLNATTLVAECYGHMFEGCGLLNRITCLATSGFGTSKCLEGWVTNVAGDGAFVKASNVTSWTTGTSGMPTGWIVCEDVLLLPPAVSFYGDTIELECDTAGAEIHYRLGPTGDFALYATPISISADTVVETYSTYQGHTSPTVTQTCAYVHETPFQRSNKELPTWRYGGGTVTTPYSVNGIDGHSSSYAKGTFSFETSVTLKEVQPTYLWFQHADQSADIYVDDVKVGTHWGGYNAFFFDISEYVHRGRNDIRVALSNNKGNYLAPAAGDFNFNATLGNVKLFTSPVLPAMEYGYDGFHITSTVSASSATINVETKVPVGASLVCTISDVNSDDSHTWTNAWTETQASTGIEQTFTTTIAGDDLHLWNGKLDPHLYTVTLEIYKDGDLYHRYERPYGFRYYEYVIDQGGILPEGSYTGFLLNGRPYKLRGVCMHDDVEGKANALTDSDYDQEFAIIEELGCNFIRLAHYPHPKEVYDRCDRLGIVVQTEVPCVNNLKSTMPEEYYTHLATQYTDMVEQHFNHPCILFWGLSNETTTDDKAFAKEKIEEYYDLIKRLDSERMVGYVMSHSYDNPSAYYNHPKVDWFGCNIYVGWYIDQNSNNPSTRLNTRIANTITSRRKPLAFSEYGCGGTQHCHSEDFKNTTTKGNYARHDIEYQMWLHEGHIAAIKTYPDLLFTSQWQLFDIAVSSRNEGYTECPDGENATTNDDLKHLNNKGLVERDHVTKKDTFYLYKAEWNSEDKFVHICGKDYTKTTERVIKCYTNDGDTLSLYVGDGETPRETVPVLNHIAVFTATDFPTGVEIRVKGATASDTVTFQ